jgi:EAL domain-containing protein (putative c-di-GMP-specific phosphodiesterase class I)/DNA-binding NarL/FixJ family response regulator
MNKLRILLVDDQKMIREGLKIILEEAEDLNIVGTANDGYQAITQVEKLKPELVLIDMEMPGLDGVSATRIICEKFPATKVLVLSGFDSNDYVKKSLSAGAKGYIVKNTPPAELIDTIRSIARGYTQIGPGLFEKLIPAVDQYPCEAIEVEIDKNTPRERTFNFNQLELWYQPVYEIDRAEIAYHEVLLRWRDDRGNIYLPDEFIPLAIGARLSQRLDRFALRKAITALAHNPTLRLSVNLGSSVIEDLNLPLDLKMWLSEAKVEPQRLHVEITETTISRDYVAALGLIERLKAINVRTIIDDFTGFYLNHSQCRQLPVDSVKINAQVFAAKSEIAKIEDQNHSISRSWDSLKCVTAKFVTDETSLELIKKAGFNQIQGNYLQKAISYPIVQVPTIILKGTNQLTKSESEKNLSVVKAPPSSQKTPISPVMEKPPKASWLRRLFFGGVFLSLGVTGLVVGLMTLEHRLTKIISESGIINGRVLRLRSPIEGTLSAFYPTPGVVVNSEQVLARIKRSDALEQAITQLEGNLQAKKSLIMVAQKSLKFLQTTLAQSQNQAEELWDVEVQVDSSAVKEKEAEIAKVSALAEFKRLEYERYRQLQAQGAVSQQLMEEKRADWQAAVAEINQVKEKLRKVTEDLRASQQRVALNDFARSGASYEEEIAQLRQEIETQQNLITTLQTEAKIAQEQLNTAQASYSERKDIEIKAPLQSVVYQTEKETGEDVNRAEELLTLLDCNNLWVEVILSAEQASLIDLQKPVGINLAGNSRPISGEIDLIQGISSQGDVERSQRLQSQALIPIIETELVGKPLTRITVNIPPPVEQAKNKQFCGLGKPARLTFATRRQSFSQRIEQFRQQQAELFAKFSWLNKLFSHRLNSN